MDALVVLIAVYIAALLLKRAMKLQAEPAQVCVATSLVLIPLLLVAWFASEGRPLEVIDSTPPPEGSTPWWWTSIPKGEDAHVPLNWLSALIWLTVLYIGATLVIWAAGTIAFMRRGTPWLSIHKAILKWPVVIVSALILLKIDLGTILLGTSVVVLGIGLVLRETLENLLTGVTLELEGTVRQGDWIQVGDNGQLGRVYEKTWRAAKLETLNNESITIPNRLLGSEHIKNLDRPQKPHARQLRVGASYKDPPIKVKDILRTILMRDSEVLPNPQPVVRTVGYEDFSITYELKFWIMDYRRRNDIEDRILTRVWYSFRFYDIEIPFPIRTVHHKELAERDAESTAAGDALGARTRFLGQLPVFEGLTPKELDFLAQNAFERSFSPREPVVHKGEVGDALYLISEGECTAMLPEREVGIGVGRYFGEMGLLGGHRRTVDVLAGSEGARVLRIDRHCMHVLFEAHPELREEFDTTGKIRREELHEAPAQAARPPARLLARLRSGAKEFLVPW